MVALLAAQTEIAQAGWFKSDVVPMHLRCEYREDPLGIDSRVPRLSWKLETRSTSASTSAKATADLKATADKNLKLETGIRGIKQRAYQVLVASSEELLKKDKGDLWDSGKVASDQSIQVEYAGKPLGSGQHCYWKVRVWLASRSLGEGWSQPAFWSMGLLTPEDWIAKWVKHSGKQTSPWMRKEFVFAAVPERATAFVNVKGLYELYINGEKVGEDVLSPAVSVYRKRSLYNTYDISKYLHVGTNCVGVWLGLGINFHGDVVPLAQVQLEMLVGGKKVVVGTDTSWTCMPSTHTEFAWAWCNNGCEKMDAGRDIPGWSEVGCTNGLWRPVEEFAEVHGVATAQSCPPNRITKKFPVVQCTALTTNTWEMDFGTNLTGWMRLRLPKLAAGQKVTIRFADKRLQSAVEEVTPDKTYTPPPGTWKLDTDNGPVAYTIYNQKSEFTSAGKPGEVFCNKFNYMGFRYAIVQGLPAKPAPGDAEALFIESGLEPVGTFECSSDLLNRIHDVNIWTIRCLNLGGYMVDCPHRERLGYGDGQVSVESQIMHLDAAAFYAKWAEDWLDEQDPVTGKASQQAPMNRKPDPNDPSKGIQNPSCWLLWGGMINMLPWKTYLYYGDRRLLERAYEPMVRYPTVYMDSFFTGLDSKGCDTGCDWVAPGIGMTSPPGKDLFVNCYRVYLLDLLAKSADALGRTDDAKRCRVRNKELSALIHARYYKEKEQLYDSGRELDQAMPLLYGVVPEALRGSVAKKLEEIVMVKNKGHLDTGMLGTYFLLKSLREIGRNDLVYTMASQKDYPGWGYMLEQGATTFWEQWNGYWSQIHSCYTSPSGWMYQGLAGICPDESGPGFKKIIIKPAVVGDLTWVKCSYDSIHGTIVSHWKLETGSTFAKASAYATTLPADKTADKNLKLDVTIPINTTATVYVPAKNEAGVTESGKPAAQAAGVKFLRMEGGAAVYSVGSGTYRFQSTLPAPAGSLGRTI
jgi:alpha-L-rhamnosidase